MNAVKSSKMRRRNEIKKGKEQLTATAEKSVYFFLYEKKTMTFY